MSKMTPWWVSPAGGSLHFPHLLWQGRTEFIELQSPYPSASGSVSPPPKGVVTRPRWWREGILGFRDGRTSFREGPLEGLKPSEELLAMALRYARLAKPEVSRKFRRASPLDNLRV